MSLRKSKRIAVIAPGGRIDEAVSARVKALAHSMGPGAPEVVFDPQCFLSAGHFAGDDEARAAAFLRAANDPTIDALWFARGGYGACRIAERVIAELGPAARPKTYLGYSDAGMILAGLDRMGFTGVAHGPMPVDVRRPGGEAAVLRALTFLSGERAAGLEPSLQGAGALAFNLTILSHLLGTSLEPDFTGRVLMIEDVSEHHYRIDRALFHVTSFASVRRAAGLRLGRFSDIPPNDPPFGSDEVAIAQDWCARSGIAYLGRADIGHDTENKIVPFRRALVT